MRKFFIALSVLGLFATVTGCSCNDNKSFGIEYSLNSDGTTDGKVVLSFPYGQFDLNGNAGYKFHWSNVSDKLLSTNVLFIDDALMSNDAKVVNAAAGVNAWLESSIHIDDAEGDYDIYVKGYVKETLTGLTFSVDKHFTNKEADVEE